VRIKRPFGLTIAFRRRTSVDLRALLVGQVATDEGRRPVAVTLLDAEEHHLTSQELAALGALTIDEWTEADAAAAAAGLPASLVASLAERGLLLCDRPEERYAELRRRDDLLAAGGWHPWSAVSHFASRWQGVKGETAVPLEPVPVQELGDAEGAFAEAAARHGPSPGPFHSRADARATIALPPGDGHGELFEVLRRRSTTRLFERGRALRLEELATILRWVWGAHGWARLGEHIVVRKTSPSGGALHPVEVYPLVRDVGGLASGIYHYEAQSHGLELLREASAEEVEELVEVVASGQEWFRSAHVAFVMTARFYRTFWKYRSHAKAYRVVLLDAAHLSQTLYLVATALGLGAFVTAAVNEADAEEALGIDPWEEGVLALCGCGVLLEEGVGMTLAYEPFEPGSSI
jgi:putative peptide maturation dehydrogenase